MKDCKKKKIQKDFVAFLYGELEEEEQKHFLSHLESCPYCQRELERLKRIKIGAEYFNKDIEEAMASVDWETLPVQITDTVFKREVYGKQESWLIKISRAFFQPKLRPVYAALLIGVFLGSLLTFFVFRSPLLRQKKVEVFHAPQDFIERVELEMARRETLNYLEKSQFLILDIAQASSEEGASLWQREFASQKARDLLSKKKYINHQLDKFKMAKAKEICDQIAFLFYELTQITDQVPAWRLREIQAFIEEKQLMLKIKLLKKELEIREESEV